MKMSLLLAWRFENNNAVESMPVRRPFPSCLNPLIAKIQKQILQTDLHTFLIKNSWENLVQDQSILPWVIKLVILITFTLVDLLMLLGENWCCTLLAPKRLSLYFEARLSAKLLIWKWIFILMEIKLIFTRKVLHLALFWKWEFKELGNGLICLSK